MANRITRQPAFLYVIGDPHSRRSYSKVGITSNLRVRMNQLFADPRRKALLPDGLACFCAWQLRDMKSAARLEKALLQRNRNSYSDKRTLGWLQLKPAFIAIQVDVIADELGLGLEEADFGFCRWEGEEPSYEDWFRKKVRISLEDTRPTTPHDQVMREMQSLIK